MEAITLGQLLEAVHGTLLGDFSDLNAEIARVDTDSRSIHPGSLFIPLVGERFDGHAYIGPALESGAEKGDEALYVVTCFSDRDKLLDLPCVKKEAL